MLFTHCPNKSDLHRALVLEMGRCDVYGGKLYRKVLIVRPCFPPIQVCCRGGLLSSALSRLRAEPLISFNHHEHLKCEMPQYIFLSGLMAYLTTVVFLRLAALIKLIVMVVMVTGYLLIAEYTHPNLFTLLDETYK